MICARRAVLVVGGVVVETSPSCCWSIDADGDVLEHAGGVVEAASGVQSSRRGRKGHWFRERATAAF